jgi:hypothetical protein
MDRAASIAIGSALVFVLSAFIGLSLPLHPLLPREDPRVRRWTVNMLLEGMGLALVLGAVGLCLSVYSFNHATVTVVGASGKPDTFPGHPAGWFLLIFGLALIGSVGFFLPAALRARKTE